MNRKPIIIVAGEPNSIFFEIFFKAIRLNKFKSPLIIIASKELLQGQMKKLGFNYKINSIHKYFNEFKKLNNKKINLINVEYKFNKCFDRISSKSNNYINETFEIALKILIKNKFTKLINGPISKKHFLKGKNLGITEYLANKTKKNKEVAMLIFNKELSVSPLTTHLALKDVHKHISKQKIYTHVKLIAEFYKKNLKRNQKLQ